MSEWDGLLEGLARQMATDAAFWEVTPMAPEAHSKVEERNIGYFMTVLRAKLLPLLKAGQAYREASSEGNTLLFCAKMNMADMRWDAARGAALKEGAKCEQLRKTN